MEALIYPLILLVLIAYGYINKRSKSLKTTDTTTSNSVFRYTVYEVNSLDKSKTIVFEANKIDDIGYHIYKAYAQNLDQATVIIKDNQENKVMRLETNSESESMIGVNHPVDGHIGYLQFIEVQVRL